jgi:hypothetical protein
MDSAIIDYGDPKVAVKFFYSADEHPDSLIATFLPPSTDAGYTYRIYFVYDNARRQIETRYSTGHTTYYAYNSHDQLIMKARPVFPDTAWFAYPNDTTHNFSSTTYRAPNGQVSAPLLYTYDNHPIPQKFPLGSPIEAGYQPFTDNNVLKAAPAGQPPSNQFSYTYNEAGYPVIQRSEPVDHVVYNFTYACITLPL